MGELAHEPEAGGIEMIDRHRHQRDADDDADGAARGPERQLRIELALDRVQLVRCQIGVGVVLRHGRVRI